MVISAVKGTVIGIEVARGGLHEYKIDFGPDYSGFFYYKDVPGTFMIGEKVEVTIRGELK